VEAQRAEVRDLAAGEDLERVLVDLEAEERAEARHVLAVHLEDRLADPRTAEIHPRAALAHVGVAAARVDGLLEDRDAGLVPQALAEEHGRVRRRGEHGARDRLGDVVHLRELARADLPVDLEGGVARLHHHRVVLHHELVDALDADLVVLPAQRGQRAVEREVPRVRRHVLEAEVGLPDRGQDAHEHGMDADLAARLAHARQELVGLALEAGEAVAAEGQRVEVELEVEARDLGHEVRVADAVEHLRDDRGRAAVGIDEEELLLGADAPHALLDHPGVDHLLERPEVLQQVLHELAELLGLAGASMTFCSPMDLAARGAAASVRRVELDFGADAVGHPEQRGQLGWRTIKNRRAGLLQSRRWAPTEQLLVDEPGPSRGRR
jgi:hypothetical protein